MKLKNIKCLLAVCLCASALLVGCGQKTADKSETSSESAQNQSEDIQEASRDVFAMDTYMTVTAYGENAEAAVDAAQAEEKQKVIVIDAGHQIRAMSATEPIGPGSSQRKAKVTGGASGCVTHLPEYKLNLQVAKKLQKELVNRGYKVIMVRTKNNVRMSNVQRAKVANKYKADAFIRIHANSAGSSSVKGELPITSNSP